MINEGRGLVSKGVGGVTGILGKFHRHAHRHNLRGKWHG